jgi:uncharacterized protein
MNAAASYTRALLPRIAEAMVDTPVLLLSGPRQAGKTTLAQSLCMEIDAGHVSSATGATPQARRYLTLDDEATLLAARTDPVGLIRGLDRAAIDEIQRAPQLLLAIKQAVDSDRRPGRFVLTGSANLMALPQAADSLAGRMETLTLLPLSQSEIEGSARNWLDAAFAGQWLQASAPEIGAELVARVLRGGYPEAVARPTERRRRSWVEQYINALIQRDVRDIAEISKLAQLPLFLRALAHTSGQMCNYATLAAQVGLDAKTAARYIGVMEHMYLLKRQEVWARNRLSRAVKSPKLQFLDPLVLAHLLDLSVAQASDVASVARVRYGAVLECFVHSELLKHSASSEGRYQLHYYRDADKLEVDIVVENAAGEVLGIEVKANASVRPGDLKGLRKLAQLAGPAFKAGVVLYDGTQVLPLGEGLWAMPLPSLWGR